MAYKFFISSNYKDVDIARDLALRLEKAGMKVFMPNKHISNSDDIIKKLYNDLRKADELLVIITPDSVDSPRLSFDMGVATSLGKRITPIVQGLAPQDLPPIIKQMDYVKYADLEQFISELKHRQTSTSV